MHQWEIIKSVIPGQFPAIQFPAQLISSYDRYSSDNFLCQQNIWKCPVLELSDGKFSGVGIFLEGVVPGELSEAKLFGNGDGDIQV